MSLRSIASKTYFRLQEKRKRKQAFAPIALLNTKHGPLFVDTTDRGMVPQLVAFGEYERPIVEILKRELKPGQTFVDVGACFGVHTLLASTLVGGGGKVIAFEPDKHNAALIRASIAYRNLRNITLHEYALGGMTATKKLFFDSKNIGNHTFHEQNIVDPNGADVVEVKLFDDVCQTERVDMVKIDIQGSELEALRGAKRLLASPQLKLIIEFWPYGLRNAGTSPEELLELLFASGFTVTLIHSNKTISRSDIPATIRDCESVKAGKGFFNLYCYK